MGWSTLLHAGAWLGKGAKATIETAGKAALHPCRTVKGAAVATGVGYVGWKKLTTDKSAVEIVSDAVVGKETVEKTKETLNDVKENFSGIADNVKDTANNFQGISNFIKNTANGNGANMLSGFFRNLTCGNVSALSILGLVLSAFLLFGRTGWMGKIAGVMLAMMMVGNNSQKVQEQVANNNNEKQQQQVVPEVHRMRR